MRPSGSKKCDLAMTGWPARAYETGLRSPVVDALRQEKKLILLRFIRSTLVEYILF